MRCPRCKTDVPDSHAYCTKCRAMLYDYSPEEPEAEETPIGRAGKRLFDLLILLALLAGGIVLGRSIQWKQLLTGVAPAAAVSPSPNQVKPNTSRAASRNSKEKSEHTSNPGSGNNKEKPTEAASAEEARQSPKADSAKKKDQQ